MMKITELTGYKSYPEYKELKQTPTVKQFINLAVKAGWKLYGLGGNGAALKHPGRDYLYKIFSHRTNHGGYYDYVQWVLKHPNNQFVPKIGRPIKFQHSDLYALRIEVLDPPKGGNDPRFKKYIDPEYDLSKTSTSALDVGQELTLFDHAMTSLWYHNKDYRELWDHARDQLDNGLNNVMFRGDQLILIDPMA